LKFLFLFISGMIVFSANPVMGTNNLSPSLNPDLVSWKSLTYKAKTFFGKATAVIELNFCCQPDLHGQIVPLVPVAG